MYVQPQFPGAHTRHTSLAAQHVIPLWTFSPDLPLVSALGLSRLQPPPLFLLLHSDNAAPPFHLILTPPSLILPSSLTDEENGDNYDVVRLCGLLLQAFDDEISTACRAAVVALRTCLPTILRSTVAGLGLELLRSIFILKDNAYWLLKGEVRDAAAETLGTPQWLACAATVPALRRLTCHLVFHTCFRSLKSLARRTFSLCTTLRSFRR